MRHEQYIEWIQLAALGEIADEDRRVLEVHLDECADCRSEFEELAGMMTLVGNARTTEPSDAELSEARVALNRALEQEMVKRAASDFAPDVQDRPEPDAVRHRVAPGAMRDRFDHGSGRGGFAGLGGIVGWLQGGMSRVALAGAAAVAVGFFVGYLAFARLGVQTGPAADQRGGPNAGEPISMAQDRPDQELGPASYANVRLVDVDPRSGEVKLEYEMVRPVRLRADIEDKRVQRMLAHTVLNEKNPGVKLHAIQTIDAYVEHPEDEEVKKALIQALKNDASPGVRKHALYVLYKMPFDEDIKDACLFVLSNDENAGMRVAAINILAAATLDGEMAGKEVYDILAEQADEDDYMRIRQGAFMQEVNGNGE